MPQPKANIILRGTVENGIRRYYRPSLLKARLKALEGKEFQEIVQEKEEETTTDQHGYYRGGIIRGTCMESTLFEGWEHDDIHNFFAAEFLSYKRILLKGDDDAVTVTITQSTIDLNKKEMSAYIDKIKNWLGGEGIIVLDPDEYKSDKYRTIKRK